MKQNVRSNGGSGRTEPYAVAARLELGGGVRARVAGAARSWWLLVARGGSWS
jgi:hypothetical protein